PDPRLPRGGERRRQTGRAAGRRGLQPLRDAGDAGQSLRAPRPRGVQADGACVGWAISAFYARLATRYGRLTCAREWPERCAPLPARIVACGSDAWAKSRTVAS